MGRVGESRDYRRLAAFNLEQGYSQVEQGPALVLSNHETAYSIPFWGRYH